MCVALQESNKQKKSAKPPFRVIQNILDASEGGRKKNKSENPPPSGLISANLLQGFAAQTRNVFHGTKRRFRPRRCYSACGTVADGWPVITAQSCTVEGITQSCFSFLFQLSHRNLTLALLRLHRRRQMLG